MAPPKTSLIAKFYSSLLKYCEQLKLNDQNLRPVHNHESLRDIFMSKYQFNTSRDYSSQLYKRLKNMDLHWSIYYALYENGWTADKLIKLVQTHSSVPDTLLEHYNSEIEEYALGLRQETAVTIQAMNFPGIGIHFYLIDHLIKSFKNEQLTNGRTEFENIHIMTSYSVITSSHLFVDTNIMPSYFFNKIPANWDKVVIPVRIYPTYPRWINVTYHPVDLTVNGDMHVILVVADRVQRQLRIYDSNDDHNNDRTMPISHKQYKDITSCIHLAFLANLDVELEEIFVKTPNMAHDTGDCAVYVIKSFLCEMNNIRLPNSFNQTARNETRNWICSKLLHYLNLH